MAEEKDLKNSNYIGSLWPSVIMESGRLEIGGSWAQTLAPFCNLQTQDATQTKKPPLYDENYCKSQI